MTEAPIPQPSGELIKRPYLETVPTVYEPNQALIEASNKGEVVSEQTALEQYFQNIEAKDPTYLGHIKTLAEQRRERFPEVAQAMPERRLQFIVPAYREGENMQTFLDNVAEQLDHSIYRDWGVTFAIDYALPYRKPGEFGGFKEMKEAIDRFREENPQYAANVDYIYYTRNKETQVLPVGLARKVGEDVLMYDKYQSSKQNNSDSTTPVRPLYLGLMDVDTGSLTPGILNEMREQLPDDEKAEPVILRARGSYDKEDVRNNLFLHPLQIMWEGTTSEVAKHTKYNPFTVGRLSAVPARELAMTGGGFAKKLQFPDEDIRHAIQIAWQLDNVSTVEVSGNYSTSARREVNMVLGIQEWLKHNGGAFDFATMETGALVRMYGGWSDNTYRKNFGNVNMENGSETNPLVNPELFNEVVSPKLIEALTNATYRFAFHAMYAIDELADVPDAPEIGELKKKLLAGDIPHFRVELDTMDILRRIATQEPERFERLKPHLGRVDELARQSTVNILEQYGVQYEVVDNEPIYGLMELAPVERELEAERLQIEQEPDSVKRSILLKAFEEKKAQVIDSVLLKAPFKILDDQSAYMAKIKEEMSV